MIRIFPTELHHLRRKDNTSGLNPYVIPLFLSHYCLLPFKYQPDIIKIFFDGKQAG